MPGLAGVSARAPGLRQAVPLPEARLVRVTARLAHGAVVDPRWPLPLDGILSSAARRRLHGDLYGGQRDLHVHPLPLAAWRKGAGARWWWLASCAAWAGAEEELRYWHRRVPHAAAEMVTGSLLPPMIYEGHGRYRAYRTPLVVTVAPALEWTAAGDPDQVRDLLGDVWQAGKKRSQGEGRVLSWEVRDLGPACADSPDPAVMWHPDGRISRPVPARAAPLLGLDAPETTGGAYRPPYWRPPQDGEPGGMSRQWQEVIAPWTTRPPTGSSPQRSAATAGAA